MSLRWRLTSVIGGIVVAMVVTSSLLAFVLVQRELTREVDDFLITRSIEATSALSDIDFESVVSDPREAFRFGALARPDAGVQILLVGASEPLTMSEPFLPPSESDWSIANRAPNASPIRVLEYRQIEGERHRVLTASTTQGAIIIGRSVTGVDDTLRRLRGWLYLISLASAGIAALIGWVVADQVLRPVSRLSAATLQVTETGRFDADIPVEGRDEIGRLASSFNSMLSALRNSRDQQERLVRDANHELRTPLTSLRTNLGVLRRQGPQLDEDSRISIIGDMDSEIQELTSLVSEVVGFATASSALDQESFTSIDIAEISRVVAERTKKRTGREVTVTGARSVIVHGSGSALERAISNLVSNAAKFSNEGTLIELHVDQTAITVTDDGPGIPAEDEERIFDRFYRADQTRTLPGSGLGLAIVAEIATVHNGQAFARNRDEGGAMVGFTIETEHFGE